MIMNALISACTLQSADGQQDEPEEKMAFGRRSSFSRPRDRRPQQRCHVDEFRLHHRQRDIPRSESAQFHQALHCAGSLTFKGDLLVAFK